MKKVFKLLSIVVVLALSVGCFAACSGSGNGDNTTAASGADTPTTAAAESGSEAAEVDYTDIAATIEYGDYDGIVALTDEVLAGNYDGKVIKIDGDNSSRISNCAILEKGEDGVSRGMTWALEGNPDLSEYPADGRVVIVGVVVVGDYDVRYLSVPAENVTVVGAE